jgi:hypothetical protein
MGVCGLGLVWVKKKDTKVLRDLTVESDLIDDRRRMQAD